MSDSLIVRALDAAIRFEEQHAAAPGPDWLPWKELREELVQGCTPAGATMSAMLALIRSAQPRGAGTPRPAGEDEQAIGGAGVAP